LRRLGEICLSNGVTVISDEIHCDLVWPGHRHTPFASLSPDFSRAAVTCVSPSKTFNLAGIQVAGVVVEDQDIRLKIERAMNAGEVNEIGPFAVDALTTAWNEGGEWLDELQKYIWGNYLYLRSYFDDHLPYLKVTPLEATYLVWIDCGAFGLSSTEIARRLLDQGRLWVNPGAMYGDAGEGFIRLNIATPRATLERGLEMIRKVLGR
jgi:cystathionine beta-lyase